MHSLIQSVENKYRKAKVTDVRSGDTVRVHQKIKEGNKERVQIFEGMVVATKSKNSLTSTISVRRIASGVGVEKTFLLHSPLITKVEVTKRSKVRRNKLNYMKKRSGKSARLSGIAFDRDSVNVEEEKPTKDVQEEAKEQAKEEVKEQTEKADKPEEKPTESPKVEAKSEQSEDSPKAESAE